MTGLRRILVLLSLVAATPAMAQPAPVDRGPDQTSIWFTLGTHGGPMPNAARSQPANLLIAGQDAYLVDVGDGAAEQMAKVGVPLQRLDGIFISHLHFDHMGGLAAILGLRLQTNATGVLSIYGPPGTRALVDGIVASMRPSSEAGYGVPGEQANDPAVGVRVVELPGGESLSVGPMVVRTAENTHYSFPPDSPQFGRYASLSYRFDLPDRAILYTGDTAPSAAVDALGQGADLLVSEMIDVEGLLRSMGPQRGDAPGGPSSVLVEHLRTHHITPSQIGAMAKAMNVQQVVVTHLVIGNATPADLRRYVSEITAVHDVPVAIATDLAGY